MVRSFERQSFATENTPLSGEDLEHSPFARSEHAHRQEGLNQSLSLFILN